MGFTTRDTRMVVEFTADGEGLNWVCCCCCCCCRVKEDAGGDGGGGGVDGGGYWFTGVGAKDDEYRLLALLELTTEEGRDGLMMISRRV